jgi:two-component system, chemotaxis family, protein-glutamate methylesterase/glutaminase
VTLVADKQSENHSTGLQEHVNVLVVDDTVVYRTIVSDVVTNLDGVTLVGTASNGRMALEKMERLDVDVVLLDVEMPEMDGLEALEVIRREYPDVNVIMVSGANKHSSDVTVKALASGALDFIFKPEGRDPESSRKHLVAHIEPLLRSAVCRNRPRWQRRELTGHDAPVFKPGVSEPVSVRRVRPKPTRIDVVAIGVSTGGPDALAKVIPQLPSDLGVPVVVVQHMPPVFTKSLAESLGKKSEISVREAVDGQSIEPNVVLIAPGGRHMVVRSRLDALTGNRHPVVGLNDSPPENNCRPAVDTLFRSVADHYGGNVLAVMMTGMGSDGCEGVRAMKRKGCLCLTQTEESCVIYGMPRAVDEAGLSDERVALVDLPSRISTLVRKCV